MVQTKRKSRRPSTPEFQKLELSLKRIGNTPVQRLKWLLDFANTDLDMLYEEQRHALAYETSALSLVCTSENLVSNFRFGHINEELPQIPLKQIPDTLLRDVHADLNTGLKQLFSDNPDSGGVWELPLPTRMSLTRQSPLDAKRSRISLRFQFRDDDTKRAVLYSFADTIRDAESLLRACAECHKPFIPVRRQEYCSTKCSQKARDGRRKAK